MMTCSALNWVHSCIKKIKKAFLCTHLCIAWQECSGSQNYQNKWPTYFWTSVNDLKAKLMLFKLNFIILGDFHGGSHSQSDTICVPFEYHDHNNICHWGYIILKYILLKYFGGLITLTVTLNLYFIIYSNMSNIL